MKDRDVQRILAIANQITGDDDLTVTANGEPEPPELFGGLSPTELEHFDPVEEAHRIKRHLLWKN